MELIYRDFDILRLIKAMHDIERLKSILLEPNQIEIFNQLPKPLIVIKNNNNHRKSISVNRIPKVKNISDWALIEPKIFETMFENAKVVT